MRSDNLQRDLWLSLIMSLWQQGFDTLDISHRTGACQADVERDLHEAKDRLRRRETAS